MANLSFNEKQLIESVFGMGGGYFLNLSNRDFEEFMLDVVGYSVYAKYPGLSKAKIFREFYKDETEAYVGKAIVLAVNYMRENGLVTDALNERTENLYRFGRKLLGKNDAQFKPKESAQEVKKVSPIVHFECENPKPRLLHTKKIGGIGLVNVKRRLDLLFGADYKLSLCDEKEKYIVIMDFKI